MTPNLLPEIPDTYQIIHFLENLNNNEKLHYTMIDCFFTMGYVYNISYAHKNNS